MENKKIIIEGKEFTYGQLQELYNIPNDVIIEGCHMISTNMSDIDYQNKLQQVQAFSFYGFGEESARLLLSDDIFYSNPYYMFDKKEFTEEALIRVGFGEKQAKNHVANFNKEFKDGVPFSKLMKSIAVLGCGETIIEQYTRRYFNMPYSFESLNSNAISEMEIKYNEWLPSMIDYITSNGFKILNDVKVSEVNESTLKVILSGSPKEFGWKTKSDFLKDNPNFLEVKKMTEANILFVDNLDSKSSKTESARKLGVEIRLYK